MPRHRRWLGRRFVGWGRCAAGCGLGGPKVAQLGLRGAAKCFGCILIVQHTIQKALSMVDFPLGGGGLRIFQIAEGLFVHRDRDLNPAQIVVAQGLLRAIELGSVNADQRFLGGQIITFFEELDALLQGGRFILSDHQASARQPCDECR